MLAALRWIGVWGRGLRSPVAGASTALTLALLAACSGEQEAAVSGDAAAPPSVLAEWGAETGLTLEARVGVLDGSAEYELGRVMQVAIGKDKAFIIADDGVPALRVYDSSGTFVRVIGRNGDGPGEYRSMGGVRTLPDGRIVLWDNRRRLLTTYSDTGAVLATASVPSGLFSADLLHLQHDGTAWVRTMLISLTQPNPMVPRTVEHAWIRVAPDGAIIDSVRTPRAPVEKPSFVLWGPGGFTKPFNHEVLSTVTVFGEVLSGDNSAYVLERGTPGGERRRIEREYTPVPLRKGERAQWEARARNLEEQQRNRPAQPNVISLTPPGATYEIPAIKPAFRTLYSDSEGRAWVQRYVAADSLDAPERPAGDTRPRNFWREKSTYDVFEVDGTFLGTVILPPNTRFADARGRELWVVGAGEEGEDMVARYRIGGTALSDDGVARLPTGSSPPL